jgi:hypothetical protein
MHLFAVTFIACFKIYGKRMFSLSMPFAGRGLLHLQVAVCAEKTSLSVGGCAIEIALFYMTG